MIWIACLASAHAGWVRIDTGHFAVYGADAVSARTAAVRLETFHAALSQLYVAGLPARPPARIPVVAFEDSHALANHAPPQDNGRDDNNLGGLFWARPGSALIALAVESGARMVEHEYVLHAMTSPRTPLPLWFAEGLAEYYATLQPVSARTVRVGAPAPWHLEVLRDRAWIPLDRVLVVDYRDAEYRDDDRQFLVRAESWLLVHWCLADPENQRPAQLASLATQLDAGASPADAVQAAFHLTMDELTQALARYAAGATLPTRSITVPDPLPNVKAKPVSITDAERDAVLGSLDAWAGRLPAAEQELLAAVAGAPDSAFAWEATAQLARVQGDRARELEALGKSVALGSESPAVHYDYARALASAPSPDLAAVRRELERSIALDADLVDAYADLVDALVALQDLAAADEWVQKGLAVDGDSSALRIRLAESHARNQRLPYARKTLERVLASETDPALRERAQRLLDALPAPPGAP